MHKDNNFTSPFQSRDGSLRGLKRLSKTKAITKELKPTKDLVRSGMDQEPKLSFHQSSTKTKASKIVKDDSVEFDLDGLQSKSTSTALNSELPESLFSYVTPKKNSAFKCPFEDFHSNDATNSHVCSTLEKSALHENPSANVLDLHFEDEDMRSETSIPKVIAFSPSLNLLNFDFDNRELDLFDSSVASIFFGKTQKQCLEED